MIYVPTPEPLRGHRGSGTIRDGKPMFPPSPWDAAVISGTLQVVEGRSPPHPLPVCSKEVFTGFGEGVG